MRPFAASTFFAKLLHYLELWAGLLASGSFYSPRLPIPWDSGSVRVSSPVTAARLRRICTAFPYPNSDSCAGAPSFRVASYTVNPRPLYVWTQELSSRNFLPCLSPVLIEVARLAVRETLIEGEVGASHRHRSPHPFAPLRRSFRHETLSAPSQVRASSRAFPSR